MRESRCRHRCRDGLIELSSFSDSSLTFCVSMTLSPSIFRGRLELWQLRDVPAAAERFDQQHAGVHAPAQDVDLIAFVGQRSGLSGDDLKVRIDAALVTIREKLQGFP